MVGMKRLAVVSMHTSPLTQPGSGDGGGLNVYVAELVTALAHQGVACDVFCRRQFADQEDVVEVEPGVRVVHLDAGPLDLPKEGLPGVIDEFTDRLVRHLSVEPVDAVHAHYWLSGVVGHRLKHRFDVPLGVTFHTLGRVKVSGGDWEPPSRIRAEDEVIGCADVVFASGQVEADQLRLLYGVDDERLEILTPGVDLAFFSPGQRWAARRAVDLDDHPVVLFVGRIQPLKGVELAVEAMARLGNTDAVLVIVGGPSGPDGESTLAEVQNRVAALGLTDRVRFVEPQPHHLLSTYYRAADVCVVPSRSESFGLVALEAAACGTPVVAANVGGLRNNVVDGETGLLIDGRDPGEFADAIEAILGDPLLGLRLGAHGAARAREHSWGATATRAVGVFDRLGARALVDCS